ncbi:3'(2'), 5'-bisphosphate nucleotidase [Methylomarinovum caldicuralii]|uniref:3'(2'),5'-bisphosphate nucleotidase CysQ n=1 Tax=Methylomarinovum caldicuralii TaxID=438856 RepID=A0AAU9CVT1_9GAMM|nr:3'(2'),5'-bisphosphate nucleotidase CysQ [Methylomarinovum caldicuralii]BCX82042.1 3'(2'), 5'-bisphosphate nucleotidase [Methylomarinovum caldicuralii]
MQNLPLARLLTPVIDTARWAGQRIMKIYASDFNVAFKDDRSPLTAADTAAHRCIVDSLSRLDPAFPILSEEASDLPYEERCQWRTYWLVDPLDGTKEFIHRNGQFTVNIALVHDHEPVLGVVYVPAEGTLYYGAAGQGAFKQVADGSPQPIRVRKPVPERLVIVGSRSHQTPEFAEYLRRLDGDYELISIGSSLKFCLVAEGSADLYPRLGPTSEWDTAAAHCVVVQAGGFVVDLSGKPLRYNTKASVLNPYFLAYGDDSRDWLRYLPESL